MSWHGYFGDAGGTLADLLGYGAQQQNPHYWGAMQNQAAAQSNFSSAYNQQCMNQMLNQFVAHPAPTRIPSGVARKADCKGCGAPLKAYIHHCEYCRRATC